MAESGIIKMFNTEKGFGFIKPDAGGPDVFLHMSAAKEPGTTFSEGQAVSYKLVDGRDGRKAAGVVEILSD